MMFQGSLDETQLPSMIRVRQSFESKQIECVDEELSRKLELSTCASRIGKGQKICITASSRGITSQKILLKAIVDFVKRQGAIPYIIPAMGSHGGATSKGQLDLLKHYGITEEFCGCEIFSSMDTTFIGTTQEGLPVFIDKFAFDSDGIIVFGRIKPHTAFKAEYESGLAKMMVIGLGNQKGAEALHNAGFGYFRERIPAYARVVLEKAPILGGIGIIENAYDKTAEIHVLASQNIMEDEPKLLQRAKKIQASILLKETDVLIVKEIGKNISGSGMDANITGTWSTPYGSGGIIKKRTVVLDITDESEGNFIGLGKADISTERAFQKLDFNSTYINVLTSLVIEPAKIPMIMPTDEQAIKAAIKTLGKLGSYSPKLVLIKNTMDLDEILVSENYISEVLAHPQIECQSDPRPLQFDIYGNLIDL